MAFDFWVESPDGTKYHKSIEEITTDGEASTKKLILRKEGPSLVLCFLEAINEYNSLDQFAKDINFFRKFVPKERFTGYPTILELYH